MPAWGVLQPPPPHNRHPTWIAVSGACASAGASASSSTAPDMLGEYTLCPASPHPPSLQEVTPPKFPAFSSLSPLCTIQTPVLQHSQAHPRRPCMRPGPTAQCLTGSSVAQSTPFWAWHAVRQEGKAGRVRITGRAAPSPSPAQLSALPARLPTGRRQRAPGRAHLGAHGGRRRRPGGAAAGWGVGGLHPAAAGLVHGGKKRKRGGAARGPPRAPRAPALRPPPRRPAAGLTIFRIQM